MKSLGLTSPVAILTMVDQDGAQKSSRLLAASNYDLSCSDWRWASKWETEGYSLGWSAAAPILFIVSPSLAWSGAPLSNSRSMSLRGKDIGKWRSEWARWLRWRRLYSWSSSLGTCQSDSAVSKSASHSIWSGTGTAMTWSARSGNKWWS